MSTNATGPFQDRADDGFVVQDDRERLIAEFTRLVHTHGYQQADLAQATEAAGLTPARAGELFASKEDCYLATVQACSEQAINVVAAAFVQTEGPWAEAVHAAMAAFLEYLAASPEFVYVVVVECHNVSPEAVRQVTQFRMDAMAILEPGFAAAEDAGLAPPRTSAEVISGGVFGLLRRYAVDGLTDDLPGALPGVSLVMLAPFVGREEAMRISQLPVG